MTALATAALLLIIPVPEPSSLIPEFIDALSAGDGQLALDMIAPAAIATIDSLLVSDPERILSVTALFGLQGLVSDSTEGGADLLLDLFQAPQVSMMLALVSITPAEPFEHAGSTFVPVTWSILSERNSVFVEVVPMNRDREDWRILDFFTTDPRDIRVNSDSSPGSRSTRSACSPG